MQMKLNESMFILFLISILENVWIVLELCELGNLHQFLISNNMALFQPASSDSELNKSMTMMITLMDMCRWSFQICNGLEYLERMCVIHADIATRNILLNSTKTAKISDFGLSKTLFRCHNFCSAEKNV